MRLNANHSGICKFGLSLEDQDNFKLVQRNVKDLYKKALNICELSAIFCVVSREQRAKYVQGQQLKRHQESENTSRKRARIADRTESGNESYDDDDGDSDNGEGLDRAAYGWDYGDSSEVVSINEEDREMRTIVMRKRIASMRTQNQIMNNKTIFLTLGNRTVYQNPQFLSLRALCIL